MSESSGAQIVFSYLFSDFFEIVVEHVLVGGRSPARHGCTPRVVPLSLNLHEDVVGEIVLEIKRPLPFSWIYVHHHKWLREGLLARLHLLQVHGLRRILVSHQVGVALRHKLDSWLLLGRMKVIREATNLLRHSLRLLVMH